MNFANVNFLAVIVAAIAGFGVGAVWYSFLFAKPWLAAMGLTEAQIRSNRSPMPFVVAMVADVVMAYILAVVLGSLAVPVSFGLGILAGAVMWLGFAITTMAVNNGFGFRNPQLTVIDGGHWLAVLLIMGAVIGAFG